MGWGGIQGGVIYNRAKNTLKIQILLKLNIHVFLYKYKHDFISIADIEFEKKYKPENSQKNCAFRYLLD